ncbi:rhomboid family intramembrane serine protease [Zymomonas mobilis]|uniref:Rhomboid family protein n=1 Tax=Zymomonas mobilis subsp. pomaceae (strain ATCC 29192 / DSM 22645 / JCM 10191 / CCUG 17912 / NBRC 13757 / NCIMB 11200 / NRRL B-4491 / Barker I) TaxID=579138 RepID=F8EVP9_ZYMMT|nr:rhomboid family intramembrane serine protease [Zymomonas mobilis]AEI38386.1 Rhomboid family protein [Zymomonas mobilis subsp. pomaceae ATCC 29192]MDX5948076.1 rhomboid family intramembrane serine protease [Zymomonas mobilis subsp. pomaceae]
MRLPPARATIGLVIITSGFWLASILTHHQDLWAMAAGFIPARLNGWHSGIPSLPFWLTPLSATVVHEGILHLGFNMLMLAFCGRYVEMVIGSGNFVFLYIVGAYVSAFSQYWINPTSYYPMIGASGAISALFGAYALLFGQERQFFSYRWLNHLIHIFWLASAWIIIQTLIGFSESNDISIATPAHIGGFLIGLLLIRPLLRFHYHKRFINF